VTGKIRLSDPDAAERLAALHYERHTGNDWSTNAFQPQRTEAMQAVVDAIDVPRRPTRSEVEHALFLRFHSPVIRRDAASAFIEAGWAVEDPEPEVDPAQVEALTKLLHDAGVYFTEATAERLLASGRVTVML
jgi:hypothetical protein